MDRLQRFVGKLFEDRISKNFDRIVPVVGDESVGKSTLILELIWMYEICRGNEPTPATVLNHVVYDDRENFREKLLHADQTDPVALMDAAHVLYKKDTMLPEQKEVERSMLDVRIENYFILMGYQDWSDIPDQLQRRRAGNLLYIPRRGKVYGFNRNQLDEKYTNLGKREWPEPVMVDTFPSLEGTALWARFEQIDAERKRDRLRGSDEDEDPEVRPRDVVEEVLEGDITQYVEEYNGRAYYNKSLLRYDYPELTDRQADQVQAALSREVDPNTLVPDTHAHGQS